MTRWLSGAIMLAMAATLPATGQNLLTNTSFDTNLAGWTNQSVAAWLGSDGDPNGSGPGCAEVQTTQANGGLWTIWEEIPVTAGNTYTIAGWTLVPSAAGNIADGGEYTIEWWTDTTYLNNSLFARISTRDQWTHLSDQAVAPASATKARVMFGVRAPYPGTGTSRARWDDVYFGSPQTEPSTADYFVLAAGYGPGKNGTFWTTDVSIYNPTLSTLQVQATFFTGAGDNSAAQPVSLGSLAPGATVSIAKVVHAAGGSGTGAVRLRFTAPAGSPSAAAVVTARTWTPWSGATVGQGATASPGASGSARAASGLVQNAAFRTNVGVFNATSNAIQVRARIFSAQGTTVYDQVWNLGPFGQYQVGLPNLGVTALDAGTLRVDGAGVIAYATPVDNSNGDAAYLEAQPIE